ncbi:hypothetical protein BsWGS_19620 [Bradybaena similaris]
MVSSLYFYSLSRGDHVSYPDNSDLGGSELLLTCDERQAVLVRLVLEHVCQVKKCVYIIISLSILGETLVATVCQIMLKHFVLSNELSCMSINMSRYTCIQTCGQGRVVNGSGLQ